MSSDTATTAAVLSEIRAPAANARRSKVRRKRQAQELSGAGVVSTDSEQEPTAEDESDTAADAPVDPREEWYTPGELVYRIKAFFSQNNGQQSIDLDPCSSRAAQRTVKARRFFTKEDDGLRYVIRFLS